MAASLIFLAYNKTSFWIDEGYSAYIASQHQLSGVFEALRKSDSGDLQTAGYYIYLWSWAKIFGVGEASLRASNLPFFVLICLSFGATSWKLLHSRYAWLVCAFCPFIWSYVNEARVYTAMLALSSVSVAALLFCVRSDTAIVRIRAALVCLIFLWLGIAMDALCLFLAPGLLLAVGLLDGRQNVRLWAKSLLFVSPLFAIEAGYILWTMKQSQTMNYETFDVRYVFLFVYELLGLQGIGPDRNHLRLLQYTPLGTQFLLAGAGVIGVVVLTAILFLYWKQSRSAKRAPLVLCLGGVISILSLCAVAVVLKERFLPRHAAAILPLFLYALLILLTNSRGKTVVASCLLALVWVSSDLRLSFDGSYAKDDYRGAARYAIQLAREENAAVLWIGDYFTPCYYGLFLSDPIHQLPTHLTSSHLADSTGWKQQATGVYASYFDQAEILKVLRPTSSAKPTYIFLTKPDLYDRRRAWLSEIRASKAPLVKQLPSFSIYRLPRTSPR